MNVLGQYHYNFVRIIPVSPGRYDIMTYWSQSRIDLATKTLFGINEQTDDLDLPTAKAVAGMFEQKFAEVDCERHERRKRKVAFPV